MICSLPAKVRHCEAFLEKTAVAHQLEPGLLLGRAGIPDYSRGRIQVAEKFLPVLVAVCNVLLQGVIHDAAQFLGEIDAARFDRNVRLTGYLAYRRVVVGCIESAMPCQPSDATAFRKAKPRLRTSCAGRQWCIPAEFS